MGGPIVFVAQDIAPSSAFERVQTALNEKGVETHTFLGMGKPYEPNEQTLIMAVKCAGVVMIGLSSSPQLAVFEIAAAATARAMKVPYGFYVDYAGAHRREWFGDLQEGAAFFLASTERMRKEVEADYPGVPVFTTGNPSREDAFFPKYTREEVRARLGVAENETMVLAPGNKQPIVNTAVWSLLLDGLESVHGDHPKRSFRVFLAYHPGDKTPHAEDPRESDPKRRPLHIYSDLIRFAPEGVRVEVLPRDVFRTDEALPGADLVVEWNTTLAINAAAQRIPVITVSTVVGRRTRFVQSGTERTEPEELGISEQAWSDVGSLSDSIKDLLDPENETSRELRAAQEAECPKPERQGMAVEAMVRIIMSFAS